MIKFEFEEGAYEATPEDQYVKEIVTLKFTCEDREGRKDSFYVPYFHKTMKDGGSFWSPSAAGVQVYGKKKYYDGFYSDSKHQDKMIKDFLTERRWEKQGQQIAQMANTGVYYPHGMAQQQQPAPAPTSMSEVAQQDELPF